MKLTFFFLMLCVYTVSAQNSYDSYLHLEGKIGDYPANIELMTGNTNFGYYYYLSQDKPIYFYIKDNTINLQLVTSENTGEEENDDEIFSGTLKNNIYSGFWKKGNNTLPFKFEIKSDPNITNIIFLQASTVVPIKTNKVEDSIQGKMSYDWYLPKDLTLQKDLVQILYPEYTDFKSYTHKYFLDFETDYKSEVEETLKDYDEIQPYMFNYEFQYYFYPVLNTKNYYVTANSTYAYTGGAHGISSQLFFTYDKKIKKWLSINDVLNLKYETQINKVLDGEVRKIYNLPENVDLDIPENSIFISPEIHYSENFTLSKNGIDFHYGLYELTPYSYGYFSLFIPYEMLKPYLQKGFLYHSDHK